MLAPSFSGERRSTIGPPCMETPGMQAVRAIRHLAPVAVLVVFGHVAAAQVHFTNVALNAGLAGELYLSNTVHGLGGAWIDVNHDDWPDLFCVNGKNKPSHLYDRKSTRLN